MGSLLSTSTIWKSARSGGRRNARRLARHIAAVAHRRRALSIAQRMLVCSEIDRQRLRNHAKVIILPNTYLIGRSLPDVGTPRSDVAPVVAMVGRMSYGPNREGAEWFLASCWPAVKRSCPQTRLRFVGFGVTDLETGGDDSIELVESPSEVAPWLSDVAVVISPLLRGSGTRVKILEAMALQKPVVSTVVGAEGLDITDGVDILLADTPDRFSAATRRLLDEPDLAIRIAQRGHQLFETRYGFGNFQTQVRCILPPPEPPRSIEQ
jgi:glycosyltransferase involved in cell wall biosynthesis